MFEQTIGEFAFWAAVISQHQPGVIGAQLPELAPVLFHPCDAMGEHLLQRFGHPLRGAAIDAEFLLDLGQRHAQIAGGRQLREAQEVGGYLDTVQADNRLSMV